MVFRSLILFLLLTIPLRAEPLAGTKPLTRKDNLSLQMVAGIDAYLTDLLEQTQKKRAPLNPDRSTPEAFDKSVAPHRARLRTLLGMVDTRLPITDLELVGSLEQPALVAETETYRVFTVRWPVFAGVVGEGLLLEPKGKVVAQVVALPDADQTPEQLVGLAAGLPSRAQFARHLAWAGCRVVVPTLINREDRLSGSAALGRWTNQPHREFLYRMSYEMGRHLIGYEVQKVLAVVDWFSREKNRPPITLKMPPIAVAGYGEGGLIAMFSGAVDGRIEATLVSGAVFPEQNQPLWEQPIYRNVWCLERDFGIPGVLQLNRKAIVEPVMAPPVKGPPALRDGRRGAAPGKLTTPEDYQTQEVIFGTPEALRQALGDLGVRIKDGEYGTAPKDSRKGFDPSVRHDRQFRELVDFTQKIMREGEAVRARDFWKTLDLQGVEAYEKSTAVHRDRLHEVLGKLPVPTLPMNPQTRQVYNEEKWTGHEVTLDLYPEVFAYGILLLPKDLKANEKRPVVVCQHGLEGTPRSCIDPEMRPIYARFAARLAEAGYIVYCPQNPYIGQDLFRVLQRKANPLGLSLFSFIVRQHERTLDWLETLPNVDAKKIAFYGLSYGGKTAMRVPALVPRYCLSICAGDFNEWIWKNVSVDFPGSYMFTGEYEMPEFNLGPTYNYAEMAALIAPRPFMVERGHDDGVGIDEWVAYEFAKVRRLYSRLKLPERTMLEFFAGGHEIRLVGTRDFLKTFVPLGK